MPESVFKLKIVKILRFESAFKLSIMVEENFENYLFQLPENTSKLSTMVGENFEIYISQVPKNAFKFSIMFGKMLKFKGLKVHLNCPL